MSDNLYIVAQSKGCNSPWGEIFDNKNFECFENIYEAIDYGNELLMDNPEEEIEVFKLVSCARTIPQLVQK